MIFIAKSLPSIYIQPVLIRHAVDKYSFLIYIYLYPGISQQLENYENYNDPDLVQAFLKKWWVESDFKVPNLPLSLRLKQKQNR
jgi:hypothetical protein